MVEYQAADMIAGIYRPRTHIKHTELKEENTLKSINFSRHFVFPVPEWNGVCLCCLMYWHLGKCAVTFHVCARV